MNCTTQPEELSGPRRKQITSTKLPSFRNKLMNKYYENSVYSLSHSFHFLIVFFIVFINISLNVKLGIRIDLILHCWEYKHSKQNQTSTQMTRVIQHDTIFLFHDSYFLFMVLVYKLITCI